MTVLFEDDLTTVIHGRWQDHLDVLDAADVLITDPPYGMSYVSNFGQEGPTAPIRGDSDTHERDSLLEEWFRAARERRPGAFERPALVFGTWRIPKPAETRLVLIWHKGDKPGLGDLTLPWGPSHEDIYVLGGRGKEHWTGKRGAGVIRANRREGSARGSYEEFGHPTPKPVLLMQDLVSHTVGDVIIDPFAGSGSTNVAARLLGRRSVAIEEDLTYAQGIVTRIERITI